MVYTPNANFNGADNFTFTVNDGEFESNISTVTITVTAINDTPIIESTPVTSVSEKALYEYALVVIDTDAGDTLTFSLEQAPQGMTLSDTGILQWQPAASDIGVHTVTINVTDSSASVVTQTFNLTVVNVNDGPVINPISDIEVTENTSTTIELSATDIDGDALTFSVSGLPAFGDFSGNTITLSPVINNRGEYGPVIVSVSDGLEQTQTSFIITVVKENQPPVIASTAPLDVLENEIYQYAVTATDSEDSSLYYELSKAPEGMSISTDGVISWLPSSDWIQSNLLPQQQCRIDGKQLTQANAAADILISIDASGSMAEERPWLKEMVFGLESRLRYAGVGSDNSENLYGLTKYNSSPGSIPLDGQKMGSYSSVLTNTTSLNGGGTEDGWNAIYGMLEEYPLRDGVSKNFILLTDEDRDISNRDLTFDSVKEKILEKGVLLNAIVNWAFECGDGREAIGMRYDGLGVVAEGNGGFSYCSGARAGTEGFITTERDYVDLAIAVKGLVWDINILRRGGDFSNSFSNAFAALTLSEVVEGLPEKDLSDLVVTDAVLNADNTSILNISVANRGLTDSETTTLSVMDNGQELAQVNIASLVPQATQTIAVTLPQTINTAGSVLDLVVNSTSDECDTENNTTRLAVAELLVQDNLGASATQSFVVLTRDVNAQPQITSTPKIEAAIDLPYEYSLAVQDDLGDGHTFTLKQAPEGMRITESGGDILWRPTVDQLGNHAVEVEVADLAGLISTQTYQVDVITGVDGLAVVSKPPTIYKEESSFDYTLDINRDSADLETVNAVLIPNECTFDSAHWNLNCTYSDLQLLNQQFSFGVTDRFGDTTVHAYRFNYAPEISLKDLIDKHVVATSHRLLGTFEKVDPEGDKVTLKVQSGPEKLYIDLDTFLEWSDNPVLESDIGEYPVSIAWEDEKGAAGVYDFTLKIVKNSPPVLINGSTNHTAVVDHQYAYNVEVYDADGDDAECAFSNIPEGMTANGWACQLRWTPTSEQLGSHSVSAEITDGFGEFINYEFTIDVIPNRPPVFTSVPVTETTDNSNYDYPLSWEDPDGDTSMDVTVEGPDGMGLNLYRNRVVWSRSSSQPGIHPVIVTIDDRFGGIATQNYELTVYPGTFSFVSLPENPSVYSGENLSAQVVALSPDRQSVSYSLSQAPVGVTINSVDGNIQWPLVNAAIGQYSITVQATDSSSNTIEASFILHVLNVPNAEPVINGTPAVTSTVGAQYQFNPQATDADGDVLSYTLNSAPVGAVVNEQTGIVSWQPTAVGDESFTLQVSDGKSQTTLAWNVVVSPNSPPQIVSTSNDITPVAQHSFSYTLDITDTENDPFLCLLLNPQAGMELTVTSTTCSLLWTPLANQLGEHTLNFSIEDDFGAKVPHAVTLTVLENQAPIFQSSPVTELDVGNNYQYLLNTVDPENDAVSYQLQQAPAGMAIVNNAITWNASDVIQGIYTVTVIASDAFGAETQQNYTLAVYPAQFSFVQIPENAWVHRHEDFSAQATALHPARLAVSYSLESGPAGLEIDAATGQLNWLNVSVAKGAYAVALKATASDQTEITAQFTVNVNTLPVIEPVTLTNAKLNKTYSYQLVASDADGDTLTYQLSTAPSSAVIDTQGLITWLPEQLDTETFTAVVSDGDEQVSTTWQVTVSDEALSANLTVTPATVNDGETVTITVNVANAAGEPTVNLLVGSQAVALTQESESQYSAAVTATGVGYHDVDVTIDDGIETLQLVEQFYVRDAADTVGPAVTLHTPTNGTSVTAPTGIAITVADDALDYWAVYVARPGVVNLADTPLAQGSQTENNNIVATLDPTLLMNGQYQVMLYAIDLNGQYELPPVC